MAGHLEKLLGQQNLSIFTQLTGLFVLAIAARSSSLDSKTFLELEPTSS